MSLADKWARFERNAVPADATPETRWLLRLAFYTGASASYNAIVFNDAADRCSSSAAGGVSDENVHDFEKVLDAIRAELVAVALEGLNVKW